MERLLIKICLVSQTEILKITEALLLGMKKWLYYNLRLGQKLFQNFFKLLKLIKFNFKP